MMVSWYGNTFCITDPMWGKSGHLWLTWRVATDAELLSCISCWTNIHMQVILHASVVLWRRYKEVCTAQRICLFCSVSWIIIRLYYPTSRIKFFLWHLMKYHHPKSKQIQINHLLYLEHTFISYLILLTMDLNMFVFPEGSMKIRHEFLFVFLPTNQQPSMYDVDTFGYVLWTLNSFRPFNVSVYQWTVPSLVQVFDHLLRDLVKDYYL